MSALRQRRLPAEEYEWAPLRLPPEVTRVSASTRVSIEAEYRGRELTRVRRHTDGSRRVLLRRKRVHTDTSIDTGGGPRLSGTPGH